MSLIPLPDTLVPFLERYLPNGTPQPGRPFITLSYAQSLDSRIASEPGQQTKISHLETKTMTHYIRSRHDAILIGSGTVLADDPKLNCRYTAPESKTQHLIRPVILDPSSKWCYSGSQLRKIVDGGEGLAPYIFVEHGAKLREDDVRLLKQQGGAFVEIPARTGGSTSKWDGIFTSLRDLGIESVMIEGGARIINDLLQYHSTSKKVIDSLIITIGPVFLGKNGVEVSPGAHVDLENVTWWTGVSDSVVSASVV